MDLIEDFINNYNLNDSWLNYTVTHQYDELKDTLMDNNYAMFFRRRYYGSINVLFEIFEKSFKCMDLGEKEWNRYHQFKEEYLSFKDRLISKIYADVLRSTSPMNDERINIQRNQAKDRELYTLIKELYIKAVRPKK